MSLGELVEILDVIHIKGNTTEREGVCRLNRIVRRRFNDMVQRRLYEVKAEEVKSHALLDEDAVNETATIGFTQHISGSDSCRVRVRSD